MTAQERKRICEDHLKQWRQLQEEVWTAEDDAANMAFTQGSGEPVQSSNISDKTYRGALVLESVEEKRKWVEVIQEAMKWLEEERPDIHRLLYGHYGMRYSRGYKRKYAEAFTRSYCSVYGINSDKYYRMRQSGLDEVKDFAIDAGMFRNCKQFNLKLNEKNPC